ncbi:unnamed protein product [Heterobilharzia americana]|nr:unnamed protein product [Heterobilharzia americana]
MVTLARILGWRILLGKILNIPHSSPSNQASGDFEGKQDEKQLIQLPYNLQPSARKVKTDECLLKLKVAGCEIPKLTKSDVNWYRLKYHENILINILQNGYHETFQKYFI